MIKLRLNFKRILLILFSIGIMLGNNSYFLWSSYDNSVVKIVALAIYYATIPILIFSLFFTKHEKNIYRLYVVAYAVILIFQMNLMGMRYMNFSPTNLFIIILISCLLSMDARTKTELLKILIFVAAICVLPSMIYFALEFFNVHVHSTILFSPNAGKVAAGVYYKHYPMGLIVQDRSAISRYCGIFDEPGVVGTIFALLTIASFKLNMSKCFVALVAIEGALSLSMAYYLMIIAFIIFESFIRGARNFAIAFMLVALAIWVFTNVQFSNEILASLQSRIDVSSKFLIVDNRTNISFNEEFSSFLSRGGYQLWMGYGRAAYTFNPRMSGACSYKCIIYDHGIIGFILYFGFFIFLSINMKVRKTAISFIAVFLISMYQRPYVFNLTYLTIFILAIGSISNTGLEEEQRYASY